MGLGKKAETIVSRGIEQSMADYTRQRLQRGPIKHAAAYDSVGTLRAMRRRGEVEHEYDERGDLVWRLIAENSKPV